MPSGVVTGSLIPAPVWLTEVADLLQQASGAEGESAYSEFLKEQMDLYQPVEEDAQDDSADSVKSPTTSFIHLRNARFFVGTTLAPNVGAHWRGRLIDVAGWSFGELSSAA